MGRNRILYRGKRAHYGGCHHKVRSLSSANSGAGKRSPRLYHAERWRTGCWQLQKTFGVTIQEIDAKQNGAVALTTNKTAPNVKETGRQ